jgi:glycosyltransferase involved in cell wall biosynthesis
MLRQAFGLRSADEIAVIHNAPRSAPAHRPASVATADAEARAAARAALGLNGQGPVVVTVGRLAREKGHDVLIAAAGRLAGEWPGSQVVIAGEGDGRDELQELIGESGLSERVHLVGQVQDVDGLLRAADVFAFPSRREGTPFALLEAMRSSVPVVTTDFGGAEEIVESGENGIVVSQDDPPALADAIRGLLRDPAQARMLAERGREQAGRFSEPEMIRQTLELLTAAADRGARA